MTEDKCKICLDDSFEANIERFKKMFIVYEKAKRLCDEFENVYYDDAIINICKSMLARIKKILSAYKKALASEICERILLYAELEALKEAAKSV